MSFLALLVILLFGTSIFAVGAYFLRKRIPALSLGLALAGLVVGLSLLGLWMVDVTGWEREGLYKQLMYGLENEDLQRFVNRQRDLQETSLMMMSTASMGLRQMAATELPAEETDRIHAQLARMAEYVTDTRRFPIWKNKRNWEQQLYFLTHAAIIIGHYQMATGDDAYNEQWTSAANYLLSGISRSQYKHLASRPEDEALRPADNAAALYALRLFDEAHNETHLAIAGEDWALYIQRELQYEDTQLPCAGFTATNRCRLPAGGTSLAMLCAYTASAGLPISREFWREFRYYHKSSFIQIFGWINEVQDGDELPDFCDQSTEPLACSRYQSYFGLLGAAKRGDRITYYQLNNWMLIQDLFHPMNDIWNRTQLEQVNAMLELSLRLAASSHR